MRIFHTVATYDATAGGGATEVVRQLSERLARRGHEVVVGTSAQATVAPYVRNGVQVQPFAIRGILGQSVLGIRGDIASYLRYLRETPFDIIMNYAAQTWHVDLTCRVLPELTARTVLCACGYSGLIGWRRPVYAAYFRCLPQYLRQYDAVVYHADDYRDKHFGDQHGIAHYRVIPNGVDEREFRQNTIDFRATYGITTPYLALTVGDHYQNKGHHRVMDAFAQLSRTDVTLVIIGRNNARWPRSCARRCAERASRSGGRILLLDHAPRAHVVAAYAAADVFLSGSYIEAFPLVILEAMAGRTPFIAFPAGNISALPGGIVVETVDAMTATLDDLLTDESRRRALGQTGQQYQAGRFEWEAVVDQYEALYQELMAKPKRLYSQQP